MAGAFQRYYGTKFHPNKFRGNGTARRECAASLRGRLTYFYVGSATLGQMGLALEPTLGLISPLSGASRFKHRPNKTHTRTLLQYAAHVCTRVLQRLRLFYGYAIERIFRTRVPVELIGALRTHYGLCHIRLTWLRNSFKIIL